MGGAARDGRPDGALARRCDFANRTRHPRARQSAPGDRRHRRPPMRRLLVVPLVVLVAIWGTLGFLAGPFVPGGVVAILAIALLATPLPLAWLLRARRTGHHPGRLARLLLLRPFWYVQLLLLLVAPAGMLGILAGLPFGRARAFGLVAAGLVAAVFAVAALMGYAGSRRLVVRRLDARIPDLPPALDGLRVAQLSDLHVGPHTSRRFLARALAHVREAQPDLVAVTGDLIDDHAADVDHYAAAFASLAAPLGVYAVAGNHDVYAGWAEVRARLERLPQRVLVNAAHVVAHRGARIAIVGTGDPAGGRGGTARGGPDLDAAFAGVPPDAFVLALVHNPALWPAVADRGARLTLSGHTHWGQFALPALGWSLASPFLEHSMGSYARGDRLLYIHPGTNYWGIPFRLGTPPEVAIVTLRRAAAGETPAVVRAGG